MGILFKGSTGLLDFTTANPSGVLYDPDDFVVTLIPPGATIDLGAVVYTYVETPPPASGVERTGFGAFRVRPPDMKPGRWHGRVRAVDPGDQNRVDVHEFSFRVHHSRVVSNAP